MHVNSENSSDNENLDIPGYRLIRYDNPSNDKRGGVCVYIVFTNTDTKYFYAS